MRSRIRCGLALLMLLTACSVPLRRGVPAVTDDSPELVTQRHVRTLGQPAPDAVRVHGSRRTAQGVVVLYTATRRDEGAPSSLGYVLAQQRDAQWSVAESTYVSGAAEPDALLDYRVGPFAEAGQSALIVYGAVQDARVVAVEARFDTGLVARDTVTDAMFGITARDVMAACEIRALDVAGTTLQRLDPARSRLAPPDAAERARRCG